MCVTPRCLEGSDPTPLFAQPINPLPTPAVLQCGGIQSLAVSLWTVSSLEARGVFRHLAEHPPTSRGIAASDERIFPQKSLSTVSLKGGWLASGVSLPLAGNASLPLLQDFQL